MVLLIHSVVGHFSQYREYFKNGELVFYRKLSQNLNTFIMMDEKFSFSLTSTIHIPNEIFPTKMRLQASYFFVSEL